MVNEDPTGFIQIVFPKICRTFVGPINELSVQLVDCSSQLFVGMRETDLLKSLKMIAKDVRSCYTNHLLQINVYTIGYALFQHISDLV